MRRRAGHAWTFIVNKGKYIPLIQNDEGRWITTGEAKDWRRCPRCRVPFENSPFECGLCSDCYFYKVIPVSEFWRLHDEKYFLAPYYRAKIAGNTYIDRGELNNGNWRKALREQIVGGYFPR